MIFLLCSGRRKFIDLIQIYVISSRVTTNDVCFTGNSTISKMYVPGSENSQVEPETFTIVFVALGLPESDEYWSSPATAWTCKKGWEGVDLEVDKALKK